MKVNISWDYDTGWSEDLRPPKEDSILLTEFPDHYTVMEVSWWRWKAYKIGRRIAYLTCNLVPWPKQVY